MNHQKCDICGLFKMCNDESECFDCIQDNYDIEDWLPENIYVDDVDWGSDDDEAEDEVE